MSRSGWIVRVGWLLGFCVVLAACAQSATAQSAPASAPAVPATAPAASAKAAEELLVAGIDAAFAGRFHEAGRRIHRAAELVPNDERIVRADRLVAAYLTGYDKAAAGRATEFEAAVRRVGQYRLAERHMGELEKSGLAGKLRGKVNEVIKAWNGAPDVEARLSGEPTDAEKSKVQAVKAMGKIRRLLAKAGKLIAGRRDEYSKLFGRTVAEADRRTTTVLKAWEALDPQDARRGREESERIKTASQSLAEALSDLEAITDEAPWRSALTQARLARMLAEDKDALARQEWFKSFVSDVETRGKAAIKDAKWYDALSAYMALRELVPTGEAYQARLKDVRHHVRVLSLYGGEAPDLATVDSSEEPGDPSRTPAHTTTQPEGGSAETQPVDEQERTWRELVRGADAATVLKAIELAGRHYVSTTDFRKLTHGALRAVRILAETPQVRQTFPGLKVEKARKMFVKDIDNRLADIDKRSWVDADDLQMALGMVLRESERTVKIPTEVLVVEFTEGFLGELDRFSNMIWPEAVSDFNKDTRGNFTGVGIQITKEKNEPLRVVTPLAGSPAHRAGIKADDLIIAVDGMEIVNMPLHKIINRIMGRAGTKVTLRIRRPGQPDFDKVVIRERITVSTIKGWRRKDGEGNWRFAIDADSSVGYVRVTQFTDTTAGNLKQALKKLRDAGVRSVVLDLRFNRGGLLRSAVDVSDQFLPGGVIVSTRGRQIAPRTRRAGSGGQYHSGDLVVLVNETSASAAEIVAGALKDRHRGVLIGQRTYGKGSVQNVLRIPGRDALLKLTTAYYYLPSGRRIHRENGATDWGVDPDVPVFVTPKQSRNWLTIRRRTDLLQEVAESELKRDLKSQYEADVQLRTAVLLLQLKRLKDAA